jgi:hypothetical protein
VISSCFSSVEGNHSDWWVVAVSAKKRRCGVLGNSNSLHSFVNQSVFEQEVLANRTLGSSVCKQSVYTVCSSKSEETIRWSCCFLIHLRWKGRKHMMGFFPK